MRYKYYIFTIIAGIIFFTACVGCFKNENTKNYFPFIIDSKFQTPKIHPVHIDSVFIYKNFLNVKVNYSGGCKKHYFTLTTDGKISIDSLKNLGLLHFFILDTMRTDACRQFKQETIIFDLVKIKKLSLSKTILKFENGFYAIYDPGR